MMEMVGTTKVYEPPITAGNRVPNVVCSRVFNPATNSNVWITLAFSSCQRGSSQLRIRMLCMTKAEILKRAEPHVSSAHLRNESGGDDDRGSQHHEVVLEPEKESLNCTRRLHH